MQIHEHTVVRQKEKYTVDTWSYKQARVSLPLLHALSHTQRDMLFL